MKKLRYSEAQIVSILKEAENGVPVSELCRTHGMSSAAFYQWRSKYGGITDIRRHKGFSHSIKQGILANDPKPPFVGVAMELK